MRASLRVEGVREARARMDQVGQRARRPEPALRARGTLEDLKEGERRIFATSGGDRKWRRIKPSWAAEKRRRGLDPRILRATGRLESAATTGHGLTFRAYNGSLFWGIPRGRSDLYYAQALAKGPRGRRMIKIETATVHKISIRVERYIADGDIR